MKKDLLKTLKVVNDFIYDFIYSDFVWWEWEKNPEISTERKQREKIQFVILVTNSWVKEMVNIE